MVSRILSLACLLAFLFPLDAISGEKRSYGDLTGVVYLGNYDGDTIRVDIPGVHPLIGENISVRVRGVDTPEIRGKCPAEKRLAKEAKELVHRILVNAGKITLKETGRGKYFRIVAYVVADGMEVSEVLLEANLAVPYQGEKKVRDWCGDPS